MKRKHLALVFLALIILLAGAGTAFYKGTSLVEADASVQVTQCSDPVDATALNTLRSISYMCSASGNSTLEMTMKANQPLQVEVSFVSSGNLSSVLYNSSVSSIRANFPSALNGTYSVQLRNLQQTVAKATGSVLVVSQIETEVQVLVPSYPYRDYGIALFVAGAALLAYTYVVLVRRGAGSQAASGRSDSALRRYSSHGRANLPAGRPAGVRHIS